jgi:hypothetical protein
LNESTSEWGATSFTPITDPETFQSHRSMIRTHFPLALSWSYSTPNQWFSVNNILNGKSESRQLSHSNKLTVDRIQTITGSAGKVHRLQFTLSLPDPTTKAELNYPCYIDIAPDLSWQIVGGRCLHEDWVIEYGKPIHGVPIMKRGIYRRLSIDETSKQDVTIPVYEVIVHKAEEWSPGNHDEFKPEFYGLTSNELKAFDPNPPVETPTVLYVALAGIVCFIGGILFIHRAMSRKPKVGEKHSGLDKNYGGDPSGPKNAVAS